MGDADGILGMVPLGDGEYPHPSHRLTAPEAERRWIIRRCLRCRGRYVNVRGVRYLDPSMAEACKVKP